MEFSYYQPTKILFGNGILKDSGTIIKALASKVLIISCGNTLMKLGVIEQLTSSLSKNSVEYHYYDDISSDPKVSEIIKGAKLFKKFAPNAIIGIGGGSAMDSAKAMAVELATNNLLHFLRNNIAAPSETLKIIAIPTTAGTSSELSKGAILSDDILNVKKGLRGENIFPKLAIIDPETTLTLPKSVTRDTGFDVIAHGIETYISKKANYITENNSLTAIRIAKKNLPVVLSDPQDRFAREQMMLATLIMGFNLANSSNCLPHRMQYPVGYETNTSHQIGLMAIYPAWIDETYMFSEEKFSVLYDIFTDDLNCHLTNKEKAKAFSTIFSQFLQLIGGLTSLTQLGVTKAMIQNFIENIDGDLTIDPGYKNTNTVKNIYLNSL